MSVLDGQRDLEKNSAAPFEVVRGTRAGVARRPFIRLALPALTNRSETLCQGHAFDEGHREVDFGVRFSDFVNGDDTRMTEAPDGQDLASKPFSTVRVVGPRRPEDFDRQTSLERLVPSGINGSLGARAEAAIDAKSIDRSEKRTALRKEIELAQEIEALANFGTSLGFVDEKLFNSGVAAETPGIQASRDEIFDLF